MKDMKAHLEKLREGPFLAICVISHARNHQVAFGAKRTLDGRQQRLARSKMTAAEPRAFQMLLGQTGLLAINAHWTATKC